MSESLKADIKAANIQVLVGFTQVLPIILINALIHSGHSCSFALPFSSLVSFHLFIHSENLPGKT